MIAKLVTTGLITGSGQILSTIGAAFLAQHLSSIDAESFIKVESYFQFISSVAYIGISLELYRLSAEDKIRDESFELCRRLMLVIGIALAISGVLILIFTKNSNLSFGLLSASICSLTLESSLYGIGLPTFAAAMSALKSSLPIAFVYIFRDIGVFSGPSEAFFAGVLFAYIGCYLLCCKYLHISIFPTFKCIRFKEYLPIFFGGLGTVSNAMQRTAPVVVFASLGSPEFSIQLYSYFKFINLYWGGLRVISQVYTRRFAEKIFARTATAVISIVTVIACLVFYFSPLKSHLPVVMPEMLWISLLLACVATAVGVGFNIRVQLLRLDREFLVINFTGLIICTLLSGVFAYFKISSIFILTLMLVLVEFTISFLLYKVSSKTIVKKNFLA